MASGFAVRKRQYYDSVFLMGINKRLSDTPGVEQTAVLMGSEANKRLLTDIGISGSEIDAAQPNDLIIAVIAESDRIVRQVIDDLDDILKSLSATPSLSSVRTFKDALKQKPNANLAVFSIPGEYVIDEARTALGSGLNVFIFSSNMPLAQELKLKQMGKEQDLLVMGPDCGTSILNGVGIGFANAVRHGTIGAVGPSGTGLQEFTSLVHNAGGGISHAIGTGSNDLSDAIAGLTTRSALLMLEADPSTEVIAIIAKPPGEKTLSNLLVIASQFKKPVIGCFLGSRDHSDGEHQTIRWAHTIDDATRLALQAAEVTPDEAPAVGLWNKGDNFEAIRDGWPSSARYLRGVFAGGTFCYQAQQIFGEAGIPVYSNSPIESKFKLIDPELSQEHTMVDMGAEHYTLGRPHPMIDSTERARRIRTEAGDPTVAILLIDFILGYNASNDPVGDMLDALQEAKVTRRTTGGELTIVASVCGTREDPQDLELQVRMLKECGVLVFSSSAQAVTFCRQLLEIGA